MRTTRKRVGQPILAAAAFQAASSTSRVNAHWRLLPILLLLAEVTLSGQVTPTPTPPPAPPPSPFAGSEACSPCHEDIFNAFQKSPHAQVDTDKHRGFPGRACESCHGPAQKHTESASAADIRQ